MNVALFSYNLQLSKSTQQTPFEVVMGRQPLIPQAVASGYMDSSPTTCELKRDWHEQLDVVRLYLD